MENDPLAFVPVVVMLQTIPHGYVITQDIVALDFRLIDTIPPSALTDIEDVVGHPARFDLLSRTYPNSRNARPTRI